MLFHQVGSSGGCDNVSQAGKADAITDTSLLHPVLSINDPSEGCPGFSYVLPDRLRGIEDKIKVTKQ